MRGFLISFSAKMHLTYVISAFFTPSRFDGNSLSVSILLFMLICATVFGGKLIGAIFYPYKCHVGVHVLSVAKKRRRKGFVLKGDATQEDRKLL